MTKTFDSQTLEKELKNVSLVESPDIGARKLPFNSLSDSDFELLLWRICQENNLKYTFYDTATLMISGADKGRDVWLTKGGNSSGLVQCKRLKTAFSLPDAIREIIKFILFAELSPQLIRDDRPFQYILALSSDPAETTLNFFTCPQQELDRIDDEILGYTQQVIKKYASFKSFSAEGKLKRVKGCLHSFTFELYRPSDLNAFLEGLSSVKGQFFRSNSGPDAVAIAEALSKKGFGGQLSTKSQEVLDRELATKVEEFRKKRFFPGSEFETAVQDLAKEIESGTYAPASDNSRSTALGACARGMSRFKDTAAAKTVVELSKKLGHSDDVHVANSILNGGADWKTELRLLGELGNPKTNTAALNIVKFHRGAQSALEWFNNAELNTNCLDADGKVTLLMVQFEAHEWSLAHSLALEIGESDFDNSPILYYLAGMARLLKAVPDDLKETALNCAPLDLAGFPLADDPSSMQDRKEAAKLLRRSAEAAANYDLEIQYHYDALALWLELRDPDTKNGALKLLASNLGNPDIAVHYIPHGINFDLAVDRDKIEKVLNRLEARRPSGNFEIAFARFVMANSAGTAEDALKYFRLHRDVIETHLTPEAVLEFEVQTCVQTGQIEPAREAIENASGKVAAEYIERIRKFASQGTTGPNIDELERQYEASPTTATLTRLVELLGKQGFSGRFYKHSRKLVKETQSMKAAEYLIGFLLENNRHDKVEAVLSDVTTLVQTSHVLRSAKAWAQFRQGNFNEALKSIVQLRNDRNEQNDRYLHQNLLIASGRWEELTAFVEEEWKNREDRTPDELHALAQLSGATGSPRLKEFLRAAAKSGGGNPGILLGCYMTATENGVEEGSEAFKWLEKAAQLSGEDGPVQSMSIEDVVKGQPEWSERVDTVWESYRKGEMPLSLVAAQLRRSSLEMQISSIVLNQKQVDPRKRSVVSAFSGMRGDVVVDMKTIGLESTALVTLASLNLLDEVIRQYDEIHIPHLTLGWLFSERRKLAFHQPSRIKSARSLLNALTSGKVREYSASMAPNAELATTVDVELAEMLTSARADDSDTQTVVVRSAPVHKIGSLMDETVDLSDFQTCLGSCQTVVDKLANLGLLIAEDEKRARTFLSRSEQRWPEEPQIEDGAHLFLDGLSVSYFQTTKLLRLLADAGFTVFVPKSAIREANALVEMAENSEEFEQIIERMRKTLCEGISQGKVLVDRIFSDDDLKAHPNIAVLQIAGKVDGLVSDDRYLNQFQHVDKNNAHTPVLTSLDLLADLNQKGFVTDAKLSHYRSLLRRAGYLLFPSSLDELLHLLDEAEVRDSIWIESANLKAFRENLLLTQMRGWLVLTKEIPWFGKLRNDLVSALVLQWKTDLSDDEARARSRWIVQLLDIRNWAGSIAENDGSELARYGWGIVCNSLALRHLDIQDDEAAERYSKWLRDEVFDVLRTSDPSVYDWLIKSLKEMLMSRLELAGAETGPVMLGILPMFLRQELVGDRSFRNAIGFEAEELLTYGKQILFARAKFFERVSEAIRDPSLQTEITDQDQKVWTLRREEISDNRVVLKISSDEESFFAAEFFVFLPDTVERLREFGVVIREHGFPPTSLGEWRDLLQERPLTGDELEKFSNDILKSPSSFLKGLRGKLETSNVSAADMVPKDPEYFENLCGKGEVSNLPDLATKIVSGAISDYLEWDEVKGARMALLLCSHSLCSHQIEVSQIKNQHLINLAEWIRDNGDIFSKVGIVEVTLPALRRLPGLEKILVEIVQQVISLDPGDKSGPLQLMVSLIVLTESEVSRTRALNHWPPFRRRLATFSHAALLAREAVNRTDVAALSTWIMKNHSRRFYLQNLVDLQAEPRWQPDYADPFQLKQELLGRLYNAVGKLTDDIPEGQLRDILDPLKPESEFNKIRNIKSFLPGPLEGPDSSFRDQMPPELETSLDQNLSESKLTAQSIASLINISGLFQVGSDKTERAAKLIGANNFRFAEQMSLEERLSLIHGLAVTAGRLRSQNLAKSVRAVSRVYREEAENESRYSDEVIVSLLAAGAFDDLDSWKDFLGEWINELCFNVPKSKVGELEESIQVICTIEPRLRSTIGAGLAALNSVK